MKFSQKTSYVWHFVGENEGHVYFDSSLCLNASLKPIMVQYATFIDVMWTLEVHFSVI